MSQGYRSIYQTRAPLSSLGDYYEVQLGPDSMLSSGPEITPLLDGQKFLDGLSDNEQRLGILLAAGFGAWWFFFRKKGRRRNPARKYPIARALRHDVWIEGGFGEDYWSGRLDKVAKIPNEGHGTARSGKEDASWHGLTKARAQGLAKRLKKAYPRARVKVTSSE